MELFPALRTLDLAITGGPCVTAGRRLAAEALVDSAALASAPPLSFRRDEGGAPLVENGWHWSQTHTRGLAAALVASAPIGIDAEWTGRLRLDVVRKRFPGELAVFGDTESTSLLRLWTAKEALLKRFGIGVADLTRAIACDVSEDAVWLNYRGARHRVDQRVLGEHWVAIAAPEEAVIRWPKVEAGTP